MRSTQTAEGWAYRRGTTQETPRQAQQGSSSRRPGPPGRFSSGGRPTRPHGVLGRDGPGRADYPARDIRRALRQTMAGQPHQGNLHAPTAAPAFDHPPTFRSGHTGRAAPAPGCALCTGLAGRGRRRDQDAPAHGHFNLPLHHSADRAAPGRRTPRHPASKRGLAGRESRYQ